MQDYTNTVQPGSTVSVLFSIRRGNLPATVWDSRVRDGVTMYLNVLGVMVLAEPVDDFSLDEMCIPQGVHRIDHLIRVLDIPFPAVDDVEEGAGQEIF